MLTLQDIFNHLTSSEMNQMQFTGDIDAPKGISPDSYPILIDYLNLGLTALHTRLNLKEREVAVGQLDELSFYILDSKYAASNPAFPELPKYIEDTPENPFQDDLIRIERVFDEVGTELPINDDTNEASVFLPRYNMVQVPYPATGNTMFILYRANHVKVPRNITDPSTVEIDIPDYCLEALTAFMVSKAYARSSSVEQQNSAVMFMNKFNISCDELDIRNVLHNNPNDTNTKLEMNGWV